MRAEGVVLLLTGLRSISIWHIIFQYGIFRGKAPGPRHVLS